MNYSPLLLQLVIILGAARLLGLVLRYFGQPAVIGEMAAGIVLGPIVFGAVAPELHAHIFEPASRGALEGLSQLGLVLFMFIVGAELRLPTGVRSQLIAASWVGVPSVLLPMGLGLAIAVPLYPVVSLPGVAFWPFALFLAAAMSITAFPVMARILKDRGETQTTIGRLAMTSAAVADVMAWIMLALVVVLASSARDWHAFVRQIAGAGLGARISGQPWRESLAVGSLMNARGLMELIVMKVGLDIGVIGKELFTMLLVMAILTTVMTSPLLILFSRKSRITAESGRRVR